jgi:hypothetical protein
MRTKALISVGFVVALLLVFGCPKKQDAPAPSQQPVQNTPTLTGLPVEMTVMQRTTTAVPESGALVSVTIDDITRGQAMISLVGKNGDVLLGPTSLEEGKSAAFELGAKSYYILLKDLDNELVGDDSATLVFTESLPTESTSTEDASDGVRSATQERAAIEQLIRHVGSLEGAVFIRNGEEHSPAAAAEHLRRKWEAAGDEIATADAFIDQLASKSSVSGEPYIIRLKDGTETPAGEYLRRRLADFKQAE